MAVAKDNRSRWLYGTVLLRALALGCSIFSKNNATRTLQTTVPQRRHSDTMSRAHWPDLVSWVVRAWSSM